MGRLRRQNLTKIVLGHFYVIKVCCLTDQSKWISIFFRRIKDGPKGSPVPIHITRTVSIRHTSETTFRSPRGTNKCLCSYRFFAPLQHEIQGLLPYNHIDIKDLISFCQNLQMPPFPWVCGDSTMMETIERKQRLCREIRARQRPPEWSQTESMPSCKKANGQKKYSPPPYPSQTTVFWDTAI